MQILKRNWFGCTFAMLAFSIAGFVSLLEYQKSPARWRGKGASRLARGDAGKLGVTSWPIYDFGLRHGKV